MKRIIQVSLFLILFSVSVLADSITISWNRITDNENIRGYTLTYGNLNSVVSFTRNVGKVTRYTVSNIHKGEPYVFILKCYGNDGELLGESKCEYTISASRHKIKTTFTKITLKVEEVNNGSGR